MDIVAVVTAALRDVAVMWKNEGRGELIRSEFCCPNMRIGRRRVRAGAHRRMFLLCLEIESGLKLGLGLCGYWPQSFMHGG